MEAANRLGREVLVPAVILPLYGGVTVVPA